MATPQPLSCSTCHKQQAELTNTLKRCAKFQGALYCPRKCQTDDWKNHKRNCFSQAPHSAQSSSATPSTPPPPPPNPGPEQPTGRHNPGFNAISHLLGLGNDDYLHSLPEKEAFAQLIDCFRLRMEDENNYGQGCIGIYADESPVPVFKRFLDLAESRPGLLPRGGMQQREGSVRGYPWNAMGGVISILPWKRAISWSVTTIILCQ